MGKKDKKDDKALKKEQKAAKQAQKGSKKATKDLKKSGALDSDEEDIDKIVAEIQKIDDKKVAVTILECEQPSARVNFSMVNLPNGNMYMFGGERFNGESNTCFNEMYLYDSKKRQWFAIISENTPPARSSGQLTVLNATTLLLFGGEYATASQYHHWGDTWLFDLGTSKWTKVDAKKSPSPRSGHRMISWRNRAILYGGFYQTLTREAFYGDLWVFDGKTLHWIEYDLSKNASLSNLPSPRSGGQFIAVPNKDVAYLYGGYSEVRSAAETIKMNAGTNSNKAKNSGANTLTKKFIPIVHTDIWQLKLSSLANGQPPSWERVKPIGIAPSPRIGCTMGFYKDRLILFGGVEDSEDSGESSNGKKRKETQMRSVFFNDLYQFDIGRRRWHQLELRLASTNPSKEKKHSKKLSQNNGKGNKQVDNDNGSGDESDADHLDDDVEEVDDAIENSKNSGNIDDSAFYYYENGKLVKIEDDGEDEDEDGSAAEKDASKRKKNEEETEKGSANESSTIKNEDPSISSSKVVASESSETAPQNRPESTNILSKRQEELAQLPRPLGRLRPYLWIDGHHLYVYGGLREEPIESRGKIIGEKEVTLDDFWRIDLRDRNGWQCLIEGNFRSQFWNGDQSDDEDEEDESGSDEESDDDSDSDSESGEEDEDYDEDDENEDKQKKSQKSKSVHSSRFSRSQVQNTKEARRARQLRDELGLEDPGSTPQPGELLNQFFVRTTTHWVNLYLGSAVLREGERLWGKEIRRRAFRLARERFEAVWPTLVELHEMEEIQRKYEQEMQERMEKKEMKQKKKNSNR